MLLPPHLFCVFRYIRTRAAYAVCEEAGKTARAACFSRAAPLVYPHPPANAASCFIVIARASSFFLALLRMSRTLEIKGKAALVAFPFTLPLRPHPPVCAACLSARTLPAFALLRRSARVGGRGIAEKSAKSGDVFFVGQSGE